MTDGVEERRALLAAVAELEERLRHEERTNETRFRALTKVVGLLAVKTQLTYGDLKRGGVDVDDEDAYYLNAMVKIAEKAKAGPPLPSRRSKNRKRKRDSDE